MFKDPGEDNVNTTHLMGKAGNTAHVRSKTLCSRATDVAEAHNVIVSVNRKKCSMLDSDNGHVISIGGHGYVPTRKAEKIADGYIAH